MKIIEKIIALVNRKSGSGDNITEPFVTMIQLAQEDPEIRATLLAILSKDEFNRTSMLNTYIEEMRLKGAPASFISAIACLLDSGVAQKAYAVLQEDGKH
jgi:hypothetical protein